MQCAHASLPTVRYMLQGKELKAVQDIILKNGGLNAAIVGQSAPKIAEMAGIKVPANTKILIGEVKLVDESEPFAHEKTVTYPGDVPCQRL
ncbi:Aldehyde-alcohol dehydrogenase [Serratia fonticola]|uniref:Aldehyde-alcohol dehydrogenase n=1 Tax=Serratia fonticola TaxID=47917 RepID=A0A4U9VDV2_SERFO|nr:Aldehyde-alcohol dehydrogenase [Serratia fonticola]